MTTTPTTTPTRATIPPPPPPPAPKAPTYAEGRRAGFWRGVAAVAALAALVGGGVYLGRVSDEAARVRDREAVAARISGYLDCLDHADGIDPNPVAYCVTRFAVDPVTLRPVSANEAARIARGTK